MRFFSYLVVLVIPTAMTKFVCSVSMPSAFLQFGLLLMAMTSTSTLACPSSITEIACNTTDFETLCDLLDLADLSTMLDEEEGGPFTVFAPLDSAFELLDAAVVEALVNDTGKSISRSFLFLRLLSSVNTLSILTFNDFCYHYENT
jgi:hypothetical protein